MSSNPFHRGVALPSPHRTPAKLGVSQNFGFRVGCEAFREPWFGNHDSVSGTMEARFGSHGGAFREPWRRVSETRQTRFGNHGGALRKVEARFGNHESAFRKPCRRVSETMEARFGKWRRISETMKARSGNHRIGCARKGGRAGVGAGGRRGRVG